MRIGAVAHATGVSQRLLRYYEEQGLLKPTRLPNGYREYSDADLTTVRHIRLLLAADLPITVIAQVLPCVGGGEQLVPLCPEMGAHLRRERSRIAQTIGRLQESRALLDTVLAALPAI
jgi:DNA-binding transcriptional MerR regulator